MPLTDFDQAPPPTIQGLLSQLNRTTAMPWQPGSGGAVGLFPSQPAQPSQAAQWVMPQATTQPASTVPNGGYPVANIFGTNVAPAVVPQPQGQMGPTQTPQINLQSLFGPGGVAGYIQNGSGQPMQATVISPAVQGALNTAQQQRTSNQELGQQSLTDFTREFIANRPNMQAQATQEQGAIDQIYGTGAGSVQQQLADLNRQQTAAINAAAQSAMGRASRQNNFRRLSSPNSSYLDRLFAQDLRNVAVGAAGQAAAQGRDDLQYLTGQRTGNIGRRQEIINRLLNSNFAPVEAAQRMEGVNLNSLGALAGLDYGNNVYERPEDAAMSRLNLYEELLRRGYVRA